MAGKPKDLVGEVFGKLTVLAQGPRKSDNSITWDCLCECGNTFNTRGASLKSGNTKSCGCLSVETQRIRNTTHGMHKHPAYKVWGAIIQRTTNPNDPRWADYGGRGISCDPRWANFPAFWEDMGETYGQGLSIDRVDVNGNYCKSNCRWSNNSLQQHNQRKKSGTTSSFIGVDFHKKSGKWRASIKSEGRPLYLGIYEDEYLAAVAYDDASEQVHGDRPNGTIREK